MRTISGIIIGYLVFAASAFLLFRVTQQDPHAPTVMGFEICAILYGVFFAFLGGYWGTAIAGRSDMLVATIIAVVMAAGAISSMIAVGIGWSPMSALILMVPAELGGGYVQSRRGRRT